MPVRSDQIDDGLPGPARIRLGWSSVVAPGRDGVGCSRHDRRFDMTLTHLERLEAETIQIMREVVAETEKPVMLYSIGKDRSVMLHIARKAFYPAAPPFP